MSISSTSASGRTPSPLQEARPLHTSEIGSLKKLPDHGTEWLGSSSGVYFVNTVRRAFNAAFSESGAVDDANFPAAEDILAGRDTHAEPQQTKDTSPITNEFESLLYTAFGELPDRKAGTELVMIFFKAWHPLFPFLHGPTFLQDMEILYSEDETKHRQNGHNTKPYDVRKLITFQLVINIASLDRPDLLPASARITSTTDVSRVAGILGASHTIPTIQTLLAAELYLAATIALRAASTVGGMVLRSIFQTGLHRCPLRYASLSPWDCELRKRIFWSAYALDRHLSQSLGDPITLQDSDIDVCLSGRELHAAIPVTSSGPMLHGKVIAMHLPMPMSSSSSSDAPPPEDDEKRLREAALTAYVQYSRLTGRVIEIFHKSIHARFPKRETIVYLTSDIETWWNDLPDFLSDSPSASRPLVPFFSILYQQLLLLLNRPALSLDPTSAEFAHGLQVCIKASRTTLQSLHSHTALGQTPFLPGLLSANWMAGLIIAFACLLGKYQKAHACADITTCLELLQAMKSRHNTAKQCYTVLSSLLVDIKQRKASSTGYLALYRLEKASSESPSHSHGHEASHKRRRTEPNANTDESGTPPSVDARRSHRKQMSVDSYASPVPLPPSRLEQSSNFSVDTSTNSTNNNSMAANWNATQPYPSFNPTNTVPEYSFSSMPGMPDTMPTVNDTFDMSFLGGTNFNMADVFESATWENLVGSAMPTPMPMSMTGWDTSGQMNNG
jgi:hypothetical protein